MGNLIEKSLVLGIVASVVGLVSCVDNKYDLGDIDTNVAFNVTDLTVPVNLDAITLKSVLDLDDDDIVKEYNGEYAVVKKGEFHSNPVSISPFLINKPSITPISSDIDVKSVAGSSQIPEGATASDIPADLLLISFDIASADAATQLSLKAQNVDASIVSIDTIGTQAVLTAKLSFPGLESFVKSFYIENLVLELPKYLNASVSDGGKYDQKTGKVTFSQALLSDADMSKEVTITIADIYASAAGATLKDNVFSYQSECRAEGLVSVYGKNLVSTAKIQDLMNLQKIQYVCSLEFANDMEITKFSGSVDYTVKGLTVDPITLDDLPDVLNQTGTQIGMDNPQIYVQLNNPLYSSKVYPQAQMTFVPDPVSSEVFKTGMTAGNADNVYCFSPKQPQSYFSDEEFDYTQSVYVPFSNLGRLLYGERIPTSIAIDIEAFARQHVSQFTLGDYDAVDGKYTFFAPLLLTDDSHIAYTDTIDGWNDEDVDAITVRKVALTATVVKEIPFAVTFEVWPIDKDGNKISDVKGTAVLGKETNTELPLAIALEGNITHLDGIIIKAKLDATSEAVLGPEMTLKVSDLKVKLSGMYEKEL